MKMTLREFVEKFNNCTDLSEVVTKRGKADAEDLAEDFKRLNKKEELQKVLADNREFYFYLLRHCKDGKSYTFLQTDEEGEITANVNVFNPYSDEDGQKWHIMISVLALLDAAKYDEEFRLHMKYIDEKNLNIWQSVNIADIEIDEDGKFLKKYWQSDLKEQVKIIIGL